MKYYYPLAMSSWDCEEVKAINNVIKSGMYTMGKKVNEFEERFAKFIGSKYAVMVNSGSSANLLAIASLFYRSKNSLKNGDEVIVPAVSWPTTYYPLHQYGLKLKFIDIDKHTLNIDIESLKNAITEKTSLIFLVNLLGNPNDFNEIKKIISDKNIIVIEDCCESMGAVYNNKKCGTFGLIGTFSSFFSHHISTMEGGIIVTDDEEIYHILLSIRSHGWTRNLPFNNELIVKSKDSFNESFRFILPGYNLRPLEMCGSIGIEQLKKLNGFIQQRRKNAEVFRNVMKKYKWVRIQKEIGTSSWFGFSIVVDSSYIKRSKVINIFKASGYETRPIVTGNFVKSEVVKFFNYTIEGDLKNSIDIDKNGLFIGNHHIDCTPYLKNIEKIFDF